MKTPENSEVPNTDIEDIASEIAAFVDFEDYILDVIDQTADSFSFTISDKVTGPLPLEIHEDLMNGMAVQCESVQNAKLRAEIDADGAASIRITLDKA